MHKYAITSKPPEAGGVFNGLLAAIVAGVNNGEYTNSLSFANAAISAAPDGAPRGYANPNYEVCPRMDVVDPTSPLAIAVRAAHRRNPAGTVGYTHHHVAIETLTHISSMFAKWITEFNVLYANASQAQKEINAGNYTRIDSVREARYTDGDVEAFLSAVGSLTDGNISYPAGQTIDVDVIYSRVMAQLSSEISILDNLGFTFGERKAKEYIGLATIPKTGQNVCVLSSSTYDALFSAPWRRILTLPRIRDMMREQFEERLTTALAGLPDGAAFNEDNPYVSITEGDDVLFIPTHLPMDGTGTLTTWDSLTAAIDARPSLSMDGQETQVAGAIPAADAGRYGPNPAGQFRDMWLNQFYDMGDLVAEIISGDLDVLQPALQTVLLSCPIADPTEPSETILGPVTGSTGALGSYNRITSLVEPISGAIDVVDHSVTFTGLDPSAVSHSLPNGIMYIGDCASAKATSWIRILRELRLSYPQEVKLLMEKSGRAKKTLAVTPNRIASFDSLLAEISSSGQRDGYIQSPSLAFNVSRLTRAEQEGPVFAGGTYSAANPGSVSATPILASEANGWDRVDMSDGRYFITPDGSTVNLEFGTPSRFSGEWDAGRIATWAPDFVSESIAMGSGSVEVEVAKNFLTLPYAPLVDNGIAPRYVPGTTNADGSLPNAANPGDTKWNILRSCDTVQDFNENVFGELSEFPGYTEGVALESYHLTRGFTRGYANIQPDNNNLVGANYVEVRDQAALDTLSRHPGIAASIVVNGIQTYDQTGFAASHIPYNGFGTSLDAPAVCQWFWDPTRTQAFGSSWHRWAGVVFDNHLPHPYLPHPIAVTTAALRLSDIVGVEDANETNVGAIVNGNGGSAWLTMGGINVQTNVAPSETGSASLPGSFQGMFAGNSSTAWKAHMSSVLAADIESTVGNNVAGDPGWDTQVATVDRANVLPVADMICLTANGCARSMGGKATMTTVLRNLNDAGSSSVIATNTLTSAIPFTFEGETLTLAQNFNGGARANVALNQLIISGKGLLFEGDLYTESFLDPMAWYVSTYSGEESLIFSPFSAYWSPWDANNGFISVFAPQTGSNYLLDADVRTCLKPATTNTGVNLVKNDWFRKTLNLSSKHARMRSGSMVNPWIRASGSAGMVHLRYDNSQLSPLFAGLDRAIRDVGTQLQTGLTNSNFLEIQMAN